MFLPSAVQPIQRLLSLPPAMLSEFFTMHRGEEDKWFADCDPPHTPLGSGGSTVSLLRKAWQAHGQGLSFSEWLRASRKVLVHGGGESRRLPAYAPVGKPYIPLPMRGDAMGQSLHHLLLDFQIPAYTRVLTHAPDSYALLVSSGDVLLTFGALPQTLPEVDVLAFGMQSDPGAAQKHGVFVMRHAPQSPLAFFLQKPSATRLQQLEQDYEYLLDTGMWLLSERALTVLMQFCGVSLEEGLTGGTISPFELYAQFGLGLGEQPEWRHPDVNALTCAVVALSEPEFYHLGTSRDLLISVARLQQGATPPGSHTTIQNAHFAAALPVQDDPMLWVENAYIPASWSLTHHHLLTGVPENDWTLRLDSGVCLDFVPVGEIGWCLRPYGFEDKFAGAAGSPTTNWFGRPFSDWLVTRGLSWAQVGIDPAVDIQRAELFPCLPLEKISAEFLEWLFCAKPIPSSQWTDIWRDGPRLSAHQLLSETNVARLKAQRAHYSQKTLSDLYLNRQYSAFYRLDLDAIVPYLPALTPLPTPPPEAAAATLLSQTKDWMLRGRIARLQGHTEWAREEAEAFACLRRAIVGAIPLAVRPELRVMEDQIVWGRSPVRLDLAGGWTDTPPYCLEHASQVVNVAVDLNGQPPVQVFIKPGRHTELVIRSIDLGVEERVYTYAGLDTFAAPGSEFALAKAALALAGFLPRFHDAGGSVSLAQQLKEFGGGIEISLLAAVPQGSGLGTSSILAATLLATLSEFCGLGWDPHTLVQRTLVLEQLLTTGGGWQDQAGALFKGVKLLASAPGLEQQLIVRWLPEHLFNDPATKSLMLLYYTGITRIAKDILQEIVRGMFLNRTDVLATLQEIGHNAGATFEAIQRGDYAGLCDRMRMSWELNKRLDAGTNPPAVQAILNEVGNEIAAGKLLGAGGGLFAAACQGQAGGDSYPGTPDGAAAELAGAVC